MNQTIVKIQLRGKEYKVNCPEDQQDQLHKVVQELERRIQETQKRTMLQSSENILLMTALNLAGDIMEMQAELDLLKIGKRKKQLVKSST